MGVFGKAANNRRYPFGILENPCHSDLSSRTAKGLTNATNWNLSDRTDVCLTSFRAAAGADGIDKRTETHWPRALPVKHQFVTLLHYADRWSGCLCGKRE